MDSSLSPFFNPKGVAIIGASASPSKLSFGILKNMTLSGFEGKIYPVNPKADEILGLKSYPDILSVPDPVELAVISLPVAMIAGVLADCGKRGVKAVVVISGGFKELGAEGEALENQLVEIAHQSGIRMIGPNCVGTMDLYSGLNTTFINGVPAKGGIGFISQSGAIAGGVVDFVKSKGIGFSSFASLGNEADITETDVIEYMGQDPNVKVIAAYVEMIKDGQQFIEIARKVSCKKPIVIIKAGKTGAGARAVSSHTGSLAGSYTAYQAAFEQSGVIEVQSVAELFDVACAFDFQPLPKGKRAAILTNAGGPAALASDSLASNGLQLVDLSAETVSALRKFLNPSAQVSNPVDMLGGAEPQEYRLSLENILKDPHVDIVFPILVPQALVNTVEVAKAILETSQKTDKPVITCIMGDDSVGDARLILHASRVPMFVYPESLGIVTGAMIRYAEWQKNEFEVPVIPANIDPHQAQTIFKNAKGQGSMGESQARPLLQAYGIPIVQGGDAKTGVQAAKIADEIGYPVVMKIISPQILHKSDAGGIRLNLSSSSEVVQAFAEMTSQIAKNDPEATIEGVLIEKMMSQGQEVIVGMRRDPSFGPLMMFGLGGIYVELFKDVAFRVTPLTKHQVIEMIHSTRAEKLLSGYRGQPVADMEAVVDVILRLSQLAIDFPEIAEIEINPLSVFSQGQGAVALDARVILSEVSSTGGLQP